MGCWRWRRARSRPDAGQTPTAGSHRWCAAFARAALRWPSASVVARRARDRGQDVHLDGLDRLRGRISDGYASRPGDIGGGRHQVHVESVARDLCVQRTARAVRDRWPVQGHDSRPAESSDAVWSGQGELAIVRKGRVWAGQLGHLRRIGRGGAPLVVPPRGADRLRTARLGDGRPLGHKARRLVRGGAPAWSPDGKLIAFIDSTSRAAHRGDVGRPCPRRWSASGRGRWTGSRCRPPHPPPASRHRTRRYRQRPRGGRHQRHGVGLCAAGRSAAHCLYGMPAPPTGGSGCWRA